MENDTEQNNDSKKKFFQNIVIVLISNIISMISGILIGFIIPKIMGVSEYGYYKTFTLYSSYIGILHFGFIDGIYLKFAGKKYEELEKEKFRVYTKFLLVVEFLVSFIILIVSFAFIKTNYFLIILFVSLNVLATNIITYFEFISQITMQFKRTTTRNIIRCSLNIISVVFLFLLYKLNNVVIYNYIYVLITIIINYLLAFWYLISYRDITFGKSSNLKEERKEILSFFKLGIPLLLSNLVAQLIFIVDQQFVNIAFDNDTYSYYAFAYNMISLITIATSAISTVLYPTLKTINEESIKNNYSLINSYLLVFVAFCMVSYYPLVIIVNCFLPNYRLSLQTFLIILPGVLISSSISVIKYNCYKKFHKVYSYFIKSIIMLFVAFIADVIAYLVFKDTKSISIVSILVLFIWYILVELYFIKEFKVKWINNLLYIIIIISGFYGISFIPNVIIGAFVYLFFFILITIVLFHSEIKKTKSKIKNIS